MAIGDKFAKLAYPEIFDDMHCEELDKDKLQCAATEARDNRITIEELQEENVEIRRRLRFCELFLSRLFENIYHLNEVNEEANWIRAGTRQPDHFKL